MRNFEVSITGDYLDPSGNQYRIIFFPNPLEPPTIEELTGVANSLYTTRLIVLEKIFNTKKESITISDEIKKLTEPGEIPKEKK